MVGSMELKGRGNGTHRNKNLRFIPLMSIGSLKTSLHRFLSYPYGAIRISRTLILPEMENPGVQLKAGGRIGAKKKELTKKEK